MDVGNVLVVVVLALLIGVLGGVAVYGLVVGLLGAVSGERFVRCAICRRFGLTVGGRRHPEGCPGGQTHRSPGHARGPQLRHH